MQFIPYRMLRNQPGKFSKTLREAGQVVLTRNGAPFALLIDVDEDELDEIITLVHRLRAQQAVSSLRKQARKRGLDKLKPEEIEAEIQSVRNERSGR